jgi:hypothetical protein
MAGEVSGFHLQISLDMGEFFGVPRKELVAFFPQGTRTDSKYHRVDWEPFAAMTERVCAEVGKREALIPAGQRYTYERIGTRFTHLMTQFGGGWDRVLWATKYFFSPRLIKGYEMGYTKLGDHHFELTCSIPSGYAGCEPYFWLFAGVWTGGNKISNLKHEILSLDVHSHGSRGEIRFAKRNRASRTVFNAPWSRLKTWRELKRDTREQQVQVQELDQITRNLQESVEAVSDAVYRLDSGAVVAENTAAESLQRVEGFTPEVLTTCIQNATSGQLEIGDRVLEVRSPFPDSPSSSPGGLLVLRDRTEEVRLQRELEETPDLVRQQTGERVSTVLGEELTQVAGEIDSFLATHPDHNAAGTLQRLSALAVQCQRQAKALVDHRLRSFQTAAEWERGLEELRREYQDLYAYEVTLHGRLSPEPETAAGWSEWFLICKEAFRNAHRHSGGTSVRLDMSPGRVEILDNGNGLAERCPNSRGLGCDSMRDRAETLGWQMQPAPAPANGWILKYRGKEA